MYQLIFIYMHDLPKLHCMRKIAIGTEIIFSRNQDFDKGLINGAVGCIVSVAYKNPNKPNRLKQTDYVTTPMYSQDMIPWALKVKVKSTKRSRYMHRKMSDISVMASSMQHDNFQLCQHHHSLLTKLKEKPSKAKCY